MATGAVIAGVAYWVRGVAAACIVFSLSTAPLAAAEKRPFASGDFTSLRSATAVAISPDGNAILFEVQSFGEKGPAKHEWHTITPAGGADLKLELPEKFTPSGFTRDGALFGEYRIEDQTQLAIVPTTSGKPTKQRQADGNFHAAARQPRARHFTRWHKDCRPFGFSCQGQTRSAHGRRDR